MIAQFLSVPYVRSGRTMEGADCWGLVRLARAALFDRAPLPVLTDAKPGELRGITKAFREVAPTLRGCGPKPGAIASAWAASLCVHVGLVIEADGRHWILETDEPTGACLTPRHVFEARYSKVLYHDD